MQIICEERLFKYTLDTEEQCLFVLDRRQEQCGQITRMCHADISEELVADMCDFLFLERGRCKELLHGTCQRLVRVRVSDESEGTVEPLDTLFCVVGNETDLDTRLVQLCNPAKQRFRRFRIVVSDKGIIDVTHQKPDTAGLQIIGVIAVDILLIIVG